MKRYARGFSLIELLLYMGVFSILLLSLLQIFNSIINIQNESEATSTVSQDGQFILLRLAYDVNDATNILIPATASAQMNTLQLDKSGQTYTYTVSQGNLLITNAAGTDMLNSYDSSVSAFTVTRLLGGNGKDTVTVSFTLTGKTIRSGNKKEIKNFQTTLGLR